MTARADGLTKEGVRRKPREFGQERFRGRYQTRVGGVGHRLGVADTRALMLEQLCDFVKPGLSNKVEAANVYFTEAVDPPEEIERAMLNAVDPQHRAPHMMRAFRTMLRTYARIQWGLDLRDGSGDQ